VDFDRAVADSRRALGEILRGNADGFKELYSRRDEITLGNPFGGFGRGWEGVVDSWTVPRRTTATARLRAST
jgi:hypothetical protein